MTKDQKHELVADLVEMFRNNPNFYIADSAGMSVAEINQFRRKCFESSIKMQVIKNTLIRKALEQLEGNYDELWPVLKQPSSVMFAPVDNASAPAKLLQEFRKKSPKPVLKGAFIEASVYVGDDQIKPLTELKSKDQLLGEVIGLLQSPMANLLGALQSGGHTLSGLLKTLQDREA